jgi:hypothetical protein
VPDLLFAHKLDQKLLLRVEARRLKVRLAEELGTVEECVEFEQLLMQPEVERLVIKIALGAVGGRAVEADAAGRLVQRGRRRGRDACGGGCGRVEDDGRGDGAEGIEAGGDRQRELLPLDGVRGGEKRGGEEAESGTVAHDGNAGDRRETVCWKPVAGCLNMRPSRAAHASGDGLVPGRCEDDALPDDD